MTQYLALRTSSILEFNNDPNKVMPAIFNSIVMEDTAELDLAYECMGILSDVIGDVYELDIERLVDSMLKFGTVMYFELKRLNAYENGVLNLRYHGMLGDDIVLTRISKV
jgi:hypothetical protein